MSSYFDQMFNLGGAAVTTLTQMNSGTSAAAGSYSPLADGTLKKIFIEVTPQAATSLAQSGYITLTCTAWSPVNTMTIAFTGFGIATAPQLYGGIQAVQQYPPAGDGALDLNVKTSLPIIGKVIYFFSAVTPNIVVQGHFQ